MHHACLPSAVRKKQGKTEVAADRIVADWLAGSSPRGAAMISNPAPGESRGERECCSLTVFSRYDYRDSGGIDPFELGKP